MLTTLRDEAERQGMTIRFSEKYHGDAELLVIYGYGGPHSSIWKQHVAAGGHAAMWDVSYFGFRYLRVSIDREHPTSEQIRKTPNESSRFDDQRLSMRDDYSPEGHIVLVGMGPKVRRYLGASALDWEQRRYAELCSRFPGRRIVYRPKPRREFPRLPCETDNQSEIGAVLKGASLVVCRHSNVALDAVLAGIPYECEDGIARWLPMTDYSVERRLDLLRRAAWWQWCPDEAAEAWRFIKMMTTQDGEVRRAA